MLVVELVHVEEPHVIVGLDIVEPIVLYLHDYQLKINQINKIDYNNKYKYIDDIISIRYSLLQTIKYTFSIC